MIDAVSQIIDERQAMPHGRGLGIVVSLVLHTTFAGSFILMASRSEPGKLVRPVVVRLSPSFSGEPQSPAAPLAPKASQGREPVIEEPTSTPAPPPVVEPSNRDLPTRSDAETETVKKSAFGQNPRKIEADEGEESAKPATPQATPAPARPANSGSAGVGAGVPAVGTAGIVGLEGGDFPYTIYIQRMLALIGNNWFRPDAGDSALTQVYFIIERDGTLRDAEIEKPSGNRTFDRAALRAIIESSPLPPLPFGYSGSFLGVHLTFH